MGTADVTVYTSKRSEVLPCVADTTLPASWKPNGGTARRLLVDPDNALTTMALSVGGWVPPANTVEKAKVVAGGPNATELLARLFAVLGKLIEAALDSEPMSRSPAATAARLRTRPEFILILLGVERLGNRRAGDISTLPHHGRLHIAGPHRADLGYIEPVYNGKPHRIHLRRPANCMLEVRDGPNTRHFVIGYLLSVEVEFVSFKAPSRNPLARIPCVLNPHCWISRPVKPTAPLLRGRQVHPSTLNRERSKADGSRSFSNHEKTFGPCSTRVAPRPRHRAQRNALDVSETTSSPMRFTANGLIFCKPYRPHHPCKSQAKSICKSYYFKMVLILANTVGIALLLNQSQPTRIVFYGPIRPLTLFKHVAVR